MNITFLGGANKVGASCTLIEIEEARILVDAGIRQNVKQDTLLPDLDKVGMPDAFLLTHAHTDHTGALPELARRWPCVKGYCTPATKPITRVLLDDNKKRLGDEEQEDENPLFTHGEIEAALQYLDFMKPVWWGEPEQICDSVTATWIPAGHVLGAAMILIEGKRESILITGDVSVTDQKTIPGMSMSNLPYQPDVMVMESTYGNRPPHKDRTEEEKQLVSDIAEVIEAGGKVLIPVFAIGRAQEIIRILKKARQTRQIPERPVWVDGKMVTEVNDIYSHSCFANELLPSLKHEAEHGEDIFYLTDVIGSVPQNFNRDEVSSWDPCCIVASSGMLLKDSLSSSYAKNLGKDPKNLIVIAGYQAEGTPGHRLLNQRVLELDNEAPRPVACQVKSYSLSAHADRDQLTALVEKVQPRKLFLVHGDDRIGARKKLAKSIREKCPNVAVKLPKNGCTYTVKKWPGIAEGRSLDHSRILPELYDFVLRGGLKGPFSARQLAEIWCGTETMTSMAVEFFKLCLLWLDFQFFKRESNDRFYPRQPA